MQPTIEDSHRPDRDRLQIRTAQRGQNSASAEAHLISRVATRDGEALELLYDALGPSMYSLALCMTQSPAESEAILLEVFEFIWIHPDDFRSRDRSPREWITALVRRSALKRLRGDPQITLSPTTKASVRKSHHGHSFKNSSVALEQIQPVVRAPIVLPDSEREAVEWVYFRGRTLAEISAALDVPLATVRRRVSQGLLALAAQAAAEARRTAEIGSTQASNSAAADVADQGWPIVHSTWESMSDCVKVLSLDGRLNWINEHGLKMLELETFSEVAGKSWIDFWKDEETCKQAKATISRAREGHSSHFTGFCATARGTSKWWDITVSPISESDGRIHQILSVSRDITPAT